MKRSSRSMGLLVLTGLVIWPVEYGADATHPGATLMGKLMMEGRDPVLRTGEKAYRLSSTDPDILATLRDPRMANRPVQLKGQFKGSSGFDVQRLYVVRAGKRYRVIYYCEVCNLTAYRPGDCICCQAPMQFLEVLPEDPRGAVK